MADDDPDRYHRADAPDPATPGYDHAAGGWGSLQGVTRIFGQEQSDPEALRLLATQNKPGGMMCTACAWAKPAEPHTAEFCENGAKATLWELTPDRCTPAFFAAHTATELRGWHDYELEKAGRLTHPVRYDPDTDRYAPVSWDAALAEIADELRAMEPDAAVFYASGHAGLEASYLYGLMARAHGTNNLPQSSNMCHETTSEMLQDTIGVPVGTCTLDDFEHCDAIFFFGQNTGTNSPRFLHTLKSAVGRGCRIVTFNPIREKGLLEFVDPQNPVQMTVGSSTRISEQYYQVRAGGDVAVLAGLIKCVLAAEESAPGTVLDHDFLKTHTVGRDEMAAAVDRYGWDEIEAASGLTRAMIEAAAEVYLTSRNVMAIYGMGLTQHVHGWLNLGMLVNLLLLRGNIGRPGAGISPVRGHSNVQGQRTVGIGQKPSHMPLDRIEAQFGIDVPRQAGLNAVQACEGILDGSVKAMLMLGGNLIRALPDRERMEAAWSDLRLTVGVATKLNRTHVVPGRVSYILPCLGRTDADVQAGGPQRITIEDSLSHIHASVATAEPPSPECRSEVAVVAGLAAALLPDNPKMPWAEWTADYDRIRDAVEATFPDEFADFNARLDQPGGFYRGNAARRRSWRTESGKAQFTTPTTLTALAAPPPGGPCLTLITLRSNDQFNTTIYGFSDRLRGLSGSRDIALLNRDDIRRLGVAEGQRVSLVCAVDDGVTRRVDGLSVTPFDIPSGCVGGYYPELNGLVPLSYREEKSQTPAYKGTPVRLVP